MMSNLYMCSDVLSVFCLFCVRSKRHSFLVKKQAFCYGIPVCSIKKGGWRGTRLVRPYGR